jgi:hypothetical protein
MATVYVTYEIVIDDVVRDPYNEVIMLRHPLLAMTSRR